MPTKDDLKLLLEKYSQGKCTPEEAHALWQWIYLLDIRDQQELKATEEETIREQLHGRIFDHVRQSYALPRYPSLIKKWPLRHWRAIAASVAAIVLLGTTVLFLQHSGLPVRKLPVLASLIINDGPSVKTVYLPDSTEVILNRSASLELGEAYNRKNRVVRLKGEAYFVTHHDPTRPFIVQTGSIETRTLGTAFNIESYPSESEVRVSLLQGRVQVLMDSSNASALLDPGQMVRYDVKGNRLSQPLPIAASDVLAWTRGALVFNDIPLAEALNRVGDHYHLRLYYDTGQMKGKRVTAVFDKEMSWEGALSNILFLHNMQYTKRDSSIFIK